MAQGVERLHDASRLHALVLLIPAAIGKPGDRLPFGGDGAGQGDTIKSISRTLECFRGAKRSQLPLKSKGLLRCLHISSCLYVLCLILGQRGLSTLYEQTQSEWELEVISTY